MDDGIELNFAAPSSSVRSVGANKKGGRWTDRYVPVSGLGTVLMSRMKAKRTVRDESRPAAPAASMYPPRPTPAAATTPAPVSRPTPAQAFVRPTPAPAPVESRPRPAPAATPSFRAPPPRTAPQAARPSAPAPAPAPVARIPRPSIDRQPTAGPSTAAAPATSKTPQIISSLFTANPSRPAKKSAKISTFTGLPTNAPLADSSSFEGLGLDPLLTRHLKGKMGVDKPTGIQRSALPYMLASPLDVEKLNGDHYDEDGNPVKVEEEEEEDLRDVFIQSQTGSGKTLTYLLPIVQTLLPLSRLSYIDRSIGTLAIIMVPTRELAQQISKVLEQLLSLSLSSEDDDQQYTRWLVSGLLTGGTTKTHEKARLRKGVPILVATPGRLLDHLQNTSSFKCAKTMFLVLDEADRLMDLGFEETILGITKALEGRRKIEMGVEKEMDEEGGGTMRWQYWSRGRRTVLCSATADAKVVKLAGIALKDPITFRAEPEVPKTSAKTEKEVKEAILDANAIELPVANEDKFTPPSQLSQKYVVVPTKLRLVSLVATLRSLVAAAKGDATGTKIIVFLSSTDAVDFHWKLLGGVQMGAPEAPAQEEAEDEDENESVDGEDEDESTPKAAKPKPKAKSKKAVEDPISYSSPLFPNTTINRLHGSLPLRTRLASLAAFAAPSSTHSILLATSVASRGLDLPLVRAVVQYDLPTEGGANEYVHRVGRTARAGKGGEAWSFVGPSEEPWVEWVEQKMGRAENKGVKLSAVSVDDLLKKGFGGKGWEYEQRATDAQLAFERWVLTSEPVRLQASYRAKLTIRTRD
jgi:ATP-dependent RNA helicase DDX31/DBP7